MDYGQYKHRYIPKISRDRKRWTPLEASRIRVDSSGSLVQLSLKVTPETLFVAAQELETLKENHIWIQSLIKKYHGLRKQQVGKSVLNRQIDVLTFDQSKSKRTIVLIARQHPPEVPGGTIGFRSFFETLLKDTITGTEFRKHFTIHAFPLLNPDGVYMGNWRHNANGVDLNRDWKNFSQPETQAVRSFIQSKQDLGEKICFALDFHTSHSGPYLLVPDSVNQAKTTGLIPQWIKTIEEGNKFKISPRERSQELPYCYNYFFNEAQAEAVTYEDGDEVARDLIRKKAKVYAQALMKTLLTQHKNGTLE